jgi:norsolorinic acid ketoreductase
VWRIFSLVQTDLGDRAAQAYGLEKAPVTLDESVSGITAQVRTMIIANNNIPDMPS